MHMNNDDMNRASKQQRGLKASAFACNNCRKRKRKCDARRPTCTQCQEHRAECIYPVKRGLGAVEDRLDRIEQHIALIAHGQHDASREERETVREQGSRQRLSSGTHNAEIFEPRQGTRSETIQVFQSQGEQWPLTGVGTRLTTSPEELMSLSNQSRNDDTDAPIDLRNHLVNHAHIQKDSEQMAVLVYTMGLPDAPQELYRYLLDSYFTWIQPLWSFIYMPTFIRDMSAQGGPYFSPFLFHSILAHSTRFCCDQPAMKGYESYVDYFWIRARSMVMGEIEKPSSVATVQGLLLLSAVENSKQRVSQSWTFSGMAFRMLQDLNIHLDSTNSEINGLTEIDRETRRRLWLSSYFWDKIISLYFGRMPVLQRTESSPPLVVIDDSTEFDLWTPLGNCNASFVPRPGHVVSTFREACKAMEVLDRVLRRNLSRSSQDLPDPADQALMRDAVLLSDELPDYLRINAPENTPIHHIACLNCLIHTVIILAHRPHCELYFYRIPSIALSCISSAKSILNIAQSCFDAYGECKFHLMAYTIWTAASIFVLQLQTITGLQQHADASALMSSREEAVRLTITAKKMLDRIGRHSNGIKHIISVLHDQILMLGIDVEQNSAAPDQEHVSVSFGEQESMALVEPDITDFANFEFPIDFNAANDGRDQFIESLMQTFLN